MARLNYFLPALLFLGLGLQGLNAQRSLDAAKPQNLFAGTSWKADGVPFGDIQRESYTLTAISEDDSFQSQWGHFITFDQTSFVTHYSAPCGNDCFTTVTGEYEFVASFKIHIFVQSIARHGFCQQESDMEGQEYGYYLVERTETGWIITKG